MSKASTLVQIRPATENDLETLVDLLHRAFQEYQGVLDPPSGTHKETVESVRAKMEAGGWALAESGGEPVGCVWFEHQDDALYIGRLSVPPEYRGRGIANALMDYVEHQAQKEGILRTTLGVRLALPAMRAMYERRGYQLFRYETHPGYDAPTYALLQKLLKER